MALSLLSIALLTTSALAAPRPEVEVVQVRQLVRRQDPTSIDLSDLIPTSVDLGDILPTESLDLSSLIGDISTYLPSDFDGCLPPSDLPEPPAIPTDVASAAMTYTDVCQEPSFTGTLGEHYSSYLSAASKYESENGPALSSWINGLSTNCPYASLVGVPTDAAGLSDLIGSYTIPSCAGTTQSTAKETGSTTAKPTGSSATGGAASGTGSEKPTGTSASGSETAAQATGAAPQQSAFAAVAGVVAGFAGIVAVL